METFYFTFGHGQVPHPNYPKADLNGYVTIIAPNSIRAREKALELFGKNEDGFLLFSFQYTDETFDKSYFPKGEIEKFVVNK